MSLDDTTAALHSANQRAPLVSIHVEFDRPDICWVGAVHKLNADTMQLLEVDTQAVWKRRPRAVDLEDVTRIEFGGSYEEGLASIAGPIPLLDLQGWATVRCGVLGLSPPRVSGVEPAWPHSRQ